MMKQLIILIPFIIAQLGFGQSLIHYEENGKFGFKDSVGNIIVSPKYDDIKNFSEGFIAISINDKWGFIDSAGKELIAPKYYAVYNFHNSNAVVVSISYQKSIDEHSDKSKSVAVYKYGVVDTKGKKIIAPKYENLHKFYDGAFGIEKNGKWGLLNYRGKKVLPIMYESISSFSWEGLFGVMLNEKWGFVNEKNEIVIPFQFSYIDTEQGFSDGKIYVKRSNHSEGFYIDKNGIEITQSH